LIINGKTALITGAGRRIGRSLAIALAERGAKIAVHYNSSAKDAQETIEVIRSMGGEAEVFHAELSDAIEVEHLVDLVSDKLGPFQILINNASKFGIGPLEMVTADEWDLYMAINVKAPFLLSKLMIKNLPFNENGKIINLNDWHKARAKRLAYGVSKAALSGLTRSLAMATAPLVQVNELALGAILSPVDRVDSVAGEDLDTSLGPAERMGSLNEVANATLGLITNDFITGETIHIDGGRHIR